MTEQPESPDDASPVRVTGASLGEHPADFYRRLRREHGPVVPILLEGDVPAWFVIGYRELNHVYSNPRQFARDTRRWNAWDLVPDDWSLLPYVAWAPSMMFAEGEEHQRRAGALGDALDAVDRTELAVLSEELADGLIDRFAGDGRADLVAQYAHQLPMLVMGRLFGFPDTDVPDLVRDIILSASADERAREAHGRIHERVTRLVEERERRPGRDFPTRLLAHPAGLAREEVIMDLLVVLAVAQTPTGAWIGNTLRLMLVDDQFSVGLQGGRNSVDQALNQVIWRECPTQNVIGRFAVHACRLGGRHIQAGDLLVMGVAAGNLDPAVQPLDDRDPGNRAHMGFGHGEHGCPFPAPELAEVIARTGIGVLLDRLPDVELAIPPEELAWHTSFWMRGLMSLPVAFSPAALDVDGMAAPEFTPRV